MSETDTPQTKISPKTVPDKMVSLSAVSPSILPLYLEHEERWHWSMVKKEIDTYNIHFSSPLICTTSSKLEIL